MVYGSCSADGGVIVKPVMRTLIIQLTVVVSGVVLVNSRTYNVAARNSSVGIVDWWAGTAMEHSVRAHASGIVVPNLDDSSLIAVGFDHHKEMCIACHGSPTGGMSEAGVGLYPKAPELSEAARDWPPLSSTGLSRTG